METPKEWLLEIAESYGPIRVLGTRGFVFVVLAKCQFEYCHCHCDSDPRIHVYYI